MVCIVMLLPRITVQYRIRWVLEASVIAMYETIFIVARRRSQLLMQRHVLVD